MGFLEEIFGNGDTKKEENKNDGYSLFGGIFVNDYDNEKYQKNKINEKIKNIESKISTTKRELAIYRRKLELCKDSENSGGISFYERNIKRLESNFVNLSNEKRWLK